MDPNASLRVDRYETLTREHILARVERAREQHRRAQALLDAAHREANAKAAGEHAAEQPSTLAMITSVAAVLLLPVIVIYWLLVALDS